MLERGPTWYVRIMAHKQLTNYYDRKLKEENYCKYIVTATQPIFKFGINFVHKFGWLTFVGSWEAWAKGV